jgi:hypothetical protein
MARTAVDGRLAPGEQHHGGDHHDQAGQPAQDEGEAFPGALLGAQDQQERDERKGLKGDAQADEDEVNYHQTRLSSWTAPLNLTLPGWPARCLTRAG